MRIYFAHKALKIVPIKMNGNEIECVSFFKLLGVMINDTITWTNGLHLRKSITQNLFLDSPKTRWQITI